MKTLYEAVLEIKSAFASNAAPYKVSPALREVSVHDQMVSLHPDLLIDLFEAFDAFVDTDAGTMVQRLLESGDYTTRGIHRDAARVIEAQSTLAQIQAH